MSQNKQTDSERKAARNSDSEIGDELASLRNQIDEIDREILVRLNRRASLVQRVGGRT